MFYNLFSHFVFCSIKARELLLHQWESALNPTSEAKKALIRLKELERGDGNGQPRDAQLTLLAHSSVCWNRCVVSRVVWVEFLD